VKLIVVGGTGMIGGVALRYALGHSDVEQVVAIGRTRLDVVHSRLLQVLRRQQERANIVLENRDIQALVRQQE
jgi:dTDP-4-dehydrorhamnose reductase